MLASSFGRLSTGYIRRMRTASRSLISTTMQHQQQPSQQQQVDHPFREQQSTSSQSDIVHPALKDSFGRAHTYLRISITERCNLRCTYCMPEAGVRLTQSEKLLSASEIERIAQLFVSLGVRKIRLTGGEPTVRKDFDEILRGISSVPNLRVFGITSNGIALKRKLPLLAASGVTRLNLSCDTLDPIKFNKIARRPGLDLVLSCLDAALAMPSVFDPVKLNVVVMRGVNDDEMCDFVKLARNHSNLHIRFIEYMPFGGNNWGEPKFLPYQDMIERIEKGFNEKLEPVVDVLGSGKTPWGHKTAKMYKMESIRGEIGFVSSMSENFCGGCTRLRITADGNLKVCLFGTGEVSIRDAMRRGDSDEEIIQLIGNAVQRKDFALGGHRDRFELSRQPNRPMITIGG
mmetsp:Transcript_4225/g.7413  ORF Transcript_4225/g.7413 Transcript_4225/m.7413 type:complete len:402 (-) Transcript_4225:31-1236(-)